MTTPLPIHRPRSRLVSSVISEKALQELNVQPGERILLRTDPNGKYNKHARFNPSVLSMRAAQYLAQLPVKLVGIDAPTVENMELCDGEVHAALLKAGIPLLEGLRLEEADKENYELSAADSADGRKWRAVPRGFDRKRIIGHALPYDIHRAIIKQAKEKGGE